MVKTFRDFLGRQNFILFRNTVYDVWEQNNRTIISPDNPLLIPLPSEINNQLSLSDEYQPNRFVILATVQSPHPSINNTTQAIEAAIRLAAEQRLTRVALPLLGTGGHGLPVYQVATAIVSTINKVLKALPSNSIQEITLISQEKSAITTLREVVQDLDQQNKKSAHSHRLLDFDFEVVTVNHRGEIIKRETKQAQYFTEDLGNSITLEMVAIPSGKFMMGSPEGEGNESEKPQHEVTIQPLFMGKYPVTQAQWQSVAALPRVNRDLDPDPSHFKGDNRPVEQICWYDVVEFCARLSKKIGREYRLPSEAEWEYACRAGTTTPFHFGETITNNLANYRPRRIFANEPKGESQEETTPIRTFPPNAFGLYDMHGNVWEWCADAWHENYQEAPTDGSAWEKVNNDDDLIRLLRGGSWPFSPAYCRSAYRYSYDADDRYNTFGFRVVCSAAARTVQ
ncbi:MAG: SUMF1/EgtB/PvdO family nonheme iron enzyme [Brasilonema octagenarum HA4186-MV1]|nr:SUMF1/EgtB/PvdO family nonheme iron enzyme [Brasilonema octagenarum HA4186-MV1]